MGSSARKHSTHCRRCRTGYFTSVNQPHLKITCHSNDYTLRRLSPILPGHNGMQDFQEKFPSSDLRFKALGQTNPIFHRAAHSFARLCSALLGAALLRRLSKICFILIAGRLSLAAKPVSESWKNGRVFLFEVKGKFI